MKLKNKLYNFIHRIKPYKRKGCFNCGTYGDFIVKYDWSIPTFRYTTHNFYCNPLDENSTLNMDGGDIKPKRERMPQLKDTPNVHLSKKEEFDKKFECDLLKITDAEYFDGDEIGDAIYSWHISEMKQMLEVIEKEYEKYFIYKRFNCTDETASQFGNFVKDVIKSELRQLLNKLKEDIEK